MSGTYDSRTENNNILAMMKEKSEAAFYINRYGRIGELLPIIDDAREEFDNIDYYGSAYKTCDISYLKDVSYTIKRGATKVCIILDDALCIKTDVDTNRFGRQTQIEYEIYQKLLVSDSPALPYIVPVLRYFKRQNVAITPACEKVCSLQRACDLTGYNYNKVIDILIDAGITADLHGANCGILYGKPVVLDYGLN